MKSFSSVLLVNTLRGIIEEIEQTYPNNAALAELRLTLQEHVVLLVESRRSGPVAAFHGAA